MLINGKYTNLNQRKLRDRKIYTDKYSPNWFPNKACPGEDNLGRLVKTSKANQPRKGFKGKLTYPLIIYFEEDGTTFLNINLIKEEGSRGLLNKDEIPEFIGIIFSKQNCDNPNIVYMQYRGERQYLGCGNGVGKFRKVEIKEKYKGSKEEQIDEYIKQGLEVFDGSFHTNYYMPIFDIKQDYDDKTKQANIKKAIDLLIYNYLYQLINTEEFKIENSAIFFYSGIAYFLSKMSNRHYSIDEHIVVSGLDAGCEIDLSGGENDQNKDNTEKIFYSTKNKNFYVFNQGKKEYLIFNYFVSRIDRELFIEEIENEKIDSKEETKFVKYVRDPKTQQVKKRIVPYYILVKLFDGYSPPASRLEEYLKANKTIPQNFILVHKKTGEVEILPLKGLIQYFAANRVFKKANQLDKLTVLIEEGRQSKVARIVNPSFSESCQNGQYVLSWDKLSPKDKKSYLLIIFTIAMRLRYLKTDEVVKAVLAKKDFLVKYLDITGDLDDFIKNKTIKLIEELQINAESLLNEYNQKFKMSGLSLFTMPKERVADKKIVKFNQEYCYELNGVIEENSQEDYLIKSGNMIKISGYDGETYVGECRAKINTKSRQLRGLCADGDGTTTYSDNRKHKGNYKNGEITGKGKMTYANGDKFYGNFNKDNIEEGCFINVNGELYRGNFSHNMRHGQGWLVFPNGRRYEGTFKDNEIDGDGKMFNNEKGEKYRGNFVAGKKHGDGTMEFCDGKKFVGDYAEDLMIEGLTTYPNGDIYKGKLDKNGKRSDQTKAAQLFFANGGKYTGLFKGDKMHGCGEYIFPKHDPQGRLKYYGKFSNDKFNGQGMLSFVNGMVYSGEFVNGEFHGSGTLYISFGHLVVYDELYNNNDSVLIRNIVKIDEMERIIFTDNAKKSRSISLPKSSKKLIEELNKNQRLSRVEEEDIVKIDDKARILFKIPDFVVYFGIYKNGKKSGKGIYTLANGERFEAIFEDDKIDNRNVKSIKYFWPNGDIYEGGFNNEGQPHGIGLYTWSDGSKYRGGFEDGKMNGEGNYIWPDGSEYTGYFINNFFYGKGIYRGINGVSYDGEFKNNNREGDGISKTTFADKSSISGIYRANRVGGKITHIYGSANEFEEVFDEADKENVVENQKGISRLREKDNIKLPIPKEPELSHEELKELFNKVL